MRGGSEKVQYFLSGGFLHQGTPFNNGFTYNQQINVRSNLDAKVNKYIRLSVDLAAKKIDRVLPRDGSVNGGSMYSHVALNLPTILAKYPGTDYAAPARDGDNPLVQTSGEAGETRTDRCWRISGEKFFNVPWIDDLKIRANYGTLGNSVIGYWDYQSTINTAPRAVFGSPETCIDWYDSISINQQRPGLGEEDNR